jgi:glycosyltransferase involved in cell wall biosynthesis
MSERRPKVAFVYPNSRLQLAAEVAAGTGADSFLLGQNHLADFGYDAFVHEPRLRAVSEESGLAHRIRWNLREALVPWELGDTDVVISALPNLLPVSARLRRGPRVVLLDFALATLLDRRRGAARRVLRASLRSSAAIVALSEVQRRRLLDRIEIDPARTHTVLLGIDHEFLRPRLSTAEQPFVLAVGKDLARDYRTLAAAAAAVDAPFVVLTEPRNVRGIDLPANVAVRRGLPYAELRDLYADAACVVLPVRSPSYAYGTEGGGLTALLEAMAMGKPVVVSDRPVFHEYLCDGESGLIVPPENPEALAGALRDLLADRDRAERLGAAARETVEQRHTMRHFTAGLAEVLDSVTVRRSPAAA